jgi:hypothetical protein
MMQDVHIKLNPGLPMQKQLSLFTSTLDLNLGRNKQSAISGARFCVVLKLGHFGKQITNNWEVFKCSVGEGWSLLFGSNV